MKRESFGSRLGFILISAGCAIGLGNVWRFPYITGQYGGAAFVLIYLICLVMLGLPIMVMEFSVGRSARSSIALAFDKLDHIRSAATSSRPVKPLFRPDRYKNRPSSLHACRKSGKTKAPAVLAYRQRGIG